MTKERAVFTRAERRIIDRLRHPRAVQRWLDVFPYQHSERPATMRTFRGVVREGKAHCVEGALSAATILEQHGHEPILADMDSVDGLGHVVFLYRSRGRWGSIGRSRCPGLHGRKPVFRRVRDLVYSYYDPFVDETGRITDYAIHDLRDLDAQGVDWRLSARNVWKVERFVMGGDRRSLPGSEARYRRLYARFMRYRRKHGPVWPDYYDMRSWL